MGRGSVKRLSRMAVALAAMAVLLVWAGGARAASVPGGWWGLDAGARPTLLQTHAGSAEQEVAVGTSLFVGVRLVAEGEEIACLTTEFVVKAGAAGIICEGFSVVDDDAAQLQATLEARYGTGAVEVKGAAGGSGAVGSGEAMIVTADERGLAPLKVSLGSFGSGTASSRVIQEGGSGRIVLQAFDLGDAPIEGSAKPIVLSDRLPAGLRVDGVGAVTGPREFPEEALGAIGGLTCSRATVSCTFTGTLQPYERLEMVVWVTRTSGNGEDRHAVNISGGSAAGGGSVPVAESSFPLQFGEGSVPFGVESLVMDAEEEGGLPASQAGGHPFQLTSMLRFNETGQGPYQPAQPRNLEIKLPTGFVGDAQATPKCSFVAFSRRQEHVNECPADSTVGVASATVVEPSTIGQGALTVPVFNLTPALGEPARFGFYVDNVVVVLNTRVRAGSDYGVTTSVQDLSQVMASLSSVVTLWGVPGEAVHNNSRGWGCFPESGLIEQEGCGTGLGSERPFLTMPSSCASSLQDSVAAQSWVPGAPLLEPVFSTPQTLNGCNRELFEPELQVGSSSSSAYSPTELNVRLKVPQQTSEIPDGVAEADVLNTTVSLPAGLQLNPAAAGGLQACTEKDVGYEGKAGSELRFSEETQGEREGQEGHRFGCPEASKLGTVRISTPLLEEPITGAVYQAAQEANPFGSLLALYIVAEAPKRGVRVRLAGEVKVEPGGQIVSSFNHTPQLPFEEFELKFFGGSKSPLATTGCGTYTTTSMMESWAGGQASPLSSMQVSSGCHSPGFAPAFAAGTTNNDADAFSPLVTTLSRKDGEQALSTVKMTMPPGLAGMLSKVTLCEEAQANAGTCPAASKIGYVRVSAGVGSEPIVLPEAGKPEDPVYLTKSYKGAPFGLSIVTQAEAGPFNLDEGGHPVVVRAKVNVDPHTAQVSIESEPIPTELHNIPLDVRSVEVVVNKPGFMFNPTNCSALELTGTIGSSEGASEAVKSRFQAANCATLSFKPEFKAYAHAYHTRRKGSYLQVVVKSSKGQANIGKVHVALPKDMPSRDETLKMACTEKQFAENPSGCPAGSFVGTAKATTPVLPVPLTGPAIFVSHGGAAFPDLDVVLQGDGVTVDLTGKTEIKKNITNSIFESVPDVPVERFVLTLPEGSHSALAAYGNLCKKAQTMPTTITGQNGAVVEQATKITVMGCKAKKKAGKSSHKKKKKH